MSTSQNAQVEFEAGRTLVPFSALTDSGDHKKFTHTSRPWSRAAGFEPDIKPNGLATGGAVSPAASAQNDKVDVAALSCYLAGVLTAVAAAANVTVTRGATTNTHSITSITVKADGTIEAVAGTASTAFSETRGAAGGPPLIPVDSIEIAQVRTTSITGAPIVASEIFAVVGQHTERFDFPSWEIDPFDGAVRFLQALPLIHTGPAAKKVYAQVYTPIFQAASRAADAARHGASERASRVVPGSSSAGWVAEGRAVARS